MDVLLVGNRRCGSGVGGIPSAGVGAFGERVPVSLDEMIEQEEGGGKKVGKEEWRWRREVPFAGGAGVVRGR